jgi:hypothetical protein
MNKFGRIFILVVLIVFSGQQGFAQIELQKNDTIKVKVSKSVSADKGENKNSKEVNDNRSNNSNTNSGSQSVKHIKASRPDMSKARSARPPNIVRPTGSRIPNGIGKPAGAIRPGHG